MGGLEIDEHSRVVKGRKAIDGLYAAGEIAGGVHGNNRLGGNSLLDCVVFGRVSGKHCAEYMMGTVEPTSLGELSGALVEGEEKEAAAPAADTNSIQEPLLVGVGAADDRAWGEHPHERSKLRSILASWGIHYVGGVQNVAHDFSKLAFAISFVFLGYQYTMQDLH
jgi:hypothetical protein